MTGSPLYNKLKEIAQTHGDHAAIYENGKTWTYKELFEKVNRVASVLSTKPLNPGDKVAIMLLNQKEFFVAFFALRAVGLVPVPINIQMPPDDIKYVLRDSETKLLVTNSKFAPNFEGSPLPMVVVDSSNPIKYPPLDMILKLGKPDFEPDYEHNPDNAPHFLLYTSGTTARPKGVMLTEKNIISNVEGFTELLGLKDQQRFLLALPLFHAYGMIIGMYALFTKSLVALVPNFAPKAIAETVIDQKITILPLVPTMFTVLLKTFEKLGTEQLTDLKLCISGGAALPKALLDKVEAVMGAVVLEGYGLTETSPVLAVNVPTTGSIPGSVGQPLPNLDIQLLDDEGNIIDKATGDKTPEGEIIAKGPNIMTGYFKLPEETEKTFTKEGYFKTGDIGCFDAKGNLYISGGRKKDLIIKAGENISPLKIESVLYHHPAVAEASVIGVPDERLGEDILACIQLKEGETTTESDLKKYCAENLTPLLVPGQFKFFDELPKNPTGKILKKELREQLQLTPSA